MHPDGVLGTGKIIMRQKIFQQAITAGFGSAMLALLLKWTDSPEYTLQWNYLDGILPDTIVLNCFIVFASLMTSVRTAHAMNRFTDAAMYLHQLNACWFDSASTLLAFCRASSVAQSSIDLFQQTLIRLVSLLNALCLEELQAKSDEEEEQGKVFEFDLIDLESLDRYTQDLILQSDCKVEVVFQAIQQLVVDNMQKGVLTIAPPILTRAFQELGTGLLKYHEAQKLLRERTPISYKFCTMAMLFACCLFLPCMLANSTRGIASSFFMTFCSVFIMWYINLVADTLDNPFWKQSNTLDVEKAQFHLNKNLLSLLRQTRAPTPTIIQGARLSVSKTASTTQSLHAWTKEKRIRQPGSAPALNPNASQESMLSSTGSEGDAEYKVDVDMDLEPVGKPPPTPQPQIEEPPQAPPTDHVTVVTELGVMIPSQRRGSALKGLQERLPEPEPTPSQPATPSGFPAKVPFLRALSRSSAQSPSPQAPQAWGTVVNPPPGMPSGTMSVETLNGRERRTGKDEGESNTRGRKHGIEATDRKNSLSSFDESEVSRASVMTEEYVDTTAVGIKKKEEMGLRPGLSPIASYRGKVEDTLSNYAAPSGDTPTRQAVEEKANHLNVPISPTTIHSKTQAKERHAMDSEGSVQEEFL